MRAAVLLLFTLATPIAAAPVCSSLTTTVPQTYPAAARSLHADDFDGDGNADVIGGGTFPGATILYGRGDGTLEPPIVLLRGVHPEVYIGDVNGDGRTDVIGSRGKYQSSEIVVMTATGARTFAPPVYVPIPPHGVLLGAGDFTSDGRTDFLVARYPDLEVLASDGQGGYAVITAQQGVFLYRVAIGDVDGDGIPDLLTETDRNFKLFRGTGTGRFHGPDQIGPDLTSSTAVVGDLTGDARPDIITFGPGVRVYDGPVRGPRLAGKQILTLSETPTSAVVADFNGDGANDLALLDEGARLVIYVNDGRGNFGYRSELLAEYGSIATADFDRDGVLDLAVPGPGVTILRGNGDGTFPSARPIVSTPHFHHMRLDDSADLNGDGIDELIGVEVHDVHIGWSNGVSVLFDRVPVRLDPNDEYINARHVAVADMDGQPGPEIVIGANKRLVTISRRTGFWQQPSSQQLTSSVAGLAVFDRRVALAFWDGKLSVREPDGTVHAIGDIGPGNPWLELAAADVDGDSVKDLIVLAAGEATYPGFPDVIAPPNALDGAIFVMRGGAGGTFAPPEKIFSGYGMTHVVAADFNGDRFADLAVSTEDGGVHLLVSEGAGSFASTQIDEWDSAGLAVRDVDGDGLPDLAASSGRGVSLYRGSYAGLARGGSWMSAPDRNVAVAQLRRDGPPSLVSAYEYQWRLVAVDFECGPRRRNVRH